MKRLGLISCAILVILLSNQTSGKTLSQLVDEKEDAVRALAQDVEAAFAIRCGLAKECPCSYSSCQQAIPGSTCDATLGDELCVQNCSSAAFSGLKTSYTTSSVNLPTKVTSGANLEPNTTNTRETVCFTSNLDPKWRANYAKHGKLIGWQYFGSFSGAFRQFPGVPSSKCGNYDPRLRPWYVSASSGPKDVVIILDISLSMLTNDRIVLAKDAAKNVITALTFADYANIVTFSSGAGILHGTKLLQATNANKEILKKAIDGIVASGATNFEAAFTKSFDLIDASRPGSTSNCQTAILFLTDGEITVGSNPTSVINTRNTQLASTGSKAVIFTYSLGAGADDVVPKSIACNSGGIWQHVNENENLIDQMSLYYDYFAAGIAKNVTSMGTNKTRISWVEPYLYATGNIYGTSVSVPAYDRSTSPPRFLGVCGIDSPITDLQKIQPEYAQILARLIENSKTCPSVSLTECEIQSVRSRIGISSICSGQCSSYTNLQPTPCPGKTYSVSVWCGTVDDPKAGSWCGFQKRACCDGCVPIDCTLEFVIGLSVGISLLAIGAGIFLFWKQKGVRKKKVEMKEMEDKKKKRQSERATAVPMTAVPQGQPAPQINAASPAPQPITQAPPSPSTAIEAPPAYDAPPQYRV